VKVLRNREIHLYAQRLPAGVSSFWFRAPDADHIVYASDALSDQHRDHLVLHEVSHMLLGHRGLPMTLLSSPEAMRAVHGGATEKEAELLAGAILERWRIPDGDLLVVEADVDRVMKTYDSTWEATPHVRPRLRRRPRPGPAGRDHRPDQELG